VTMSHGQLTSSMSRRVSRHRSWSFDRSDRGPSATTRRDLGRALATASSTARVVAGRLKTNRATGVCSWTELTGATTVAAYG